MLLQLMVRKRLLPILYKYLANFNNNYTIQMEDFNYVRQNSRIDRIYVSDFLIIKIDSVKHLNYKADH